MARKEKYSKEVLLTTSIEFIRENGIEQLTARELAKYIGCSTQPFFKNYNSLSEFKADLKIYLHKDYEEFIKKYIHEDDYLYTISYAYALYGKYESNIFKSLFISDLAGSRTVDEVLSTDRNILPIKAAVNQYNITLDDANKLFRDVRFYTHGIATQLAIKSIELTDEDISLFIKHNIDINLNKERGEN